MPASCSAFGCTNRFLKENPRQFVGFPLKKPELLERWVLAVKRKNFKPTASSKICSDHFLPTDYLHRPGIYVKKLKPDAIPSVFAAFPKHLQANKKERRLLSREKNIRNVLNFVENVDMPYETRVVYNQSAIASTTCEIGVQVKVCCNNQESASSTIITNLRKKNKVLNEKIRRQNIKIKNMNDLLETLRKKKKDSDV